MILRTLLLALATAQDPEPADLDDESCTHDSAACVTTAGAHFDAGRFDRAVHLFELLVAANPTAPKYHYFAGLAREGAGHDTAAYIHLRRFLVSAADHPDERKSATRRITAILARTTRVILRTPPHDAPLTLRLTRTDFAHAGEPAIVVPLAALSPTGGAHELALTPGEWELTLTPVRLGEHQVIPLHVIVHPAARILKLELTTRPIRHILTLDLAPTRALHRGITIDLHRPRGPNLTFTSETPTIRRELPPGTWTYKARARGFLPKSQDFVLSGPLTLPVKLTPKWSGERRKRLNLGLGLAGAGLVTGIVGSVLVPVSESRIPELITIENIREAQGIRNRGDLGAVSLGVATGLWISAIAGASAQNYKRAWKVTLAGATLSTAGGILSYALVCDSCRDRDLSDGFDLFKNRHQTMLAASFLGIGLGLAVGAITTAIQQRTEKQSRLAHRRNRHRPG